MPNLICRKLKDPVHLMNRVLVVSEIKSGENRTSTPSMDKYSLPAAFRQAPLIGGEFICTYVT